MLINAYVAPCNTTSFDIGIVIVKATIKRISIVALKHARMGIWIGMDIVAGVRLRRVGS